MFNINKLHPLVWVFNKAMSDPQAMVEYYENHKEWEGWYTFGSMVPIYISNHNFNHFPTKEEWEQTIKPDPNQTKEAEIAYVQEILDLFYEGTKLYIKDNNITLNNYEFLNFSLAKYETGGSMFYHTDFQQERGHIWESKFNTTCLFYLNDNYEGGEISFAIMDDTGEIIIDLFDYKPQAGDMVIFPSNLPVYHGVKPVTQGQKYIIRTYWKTMPEPTEEWKNGIATYGKEKWKEMQEDIAKNIRGLRQVPYRDKIIDLHGLKK